jgi:signal transduction histidine kinase
MSEKKDTGHRFITLRKTGKKLTGEGLDFQARLFNIVALAGIFISLFTCVMGIFTSAGLTTILFRLLAMVLSVVLLRYALASGKYQRCYMITIICIFFCLFPALFFSAGGYHSGRPSFFIFAVLCTVIMLDGKKMIAVTFLELVFYTVLFVFAYHNQDKINFFNTEADFLFDTLLAFLAVSIALGVTMSLHFRLYKQRQAELEAARNQVEKYAEMKSELFAGMSHEMRTPLTVMSAYAQFAVEEIREYGVNEQTLADLATISDEAKRLAEMADGTLKILMGAFERPEFGSDDTRVYENSPVNVGDVCLRLVRLLKPVALRKGMELSVTVTDNAPTVTGDADAITQLVWNLLQNAITHSGGTTIDLTVGADCGNVKVTVNDDGAGVEPGILPHIFERGVSGKKGGSGIGLSICRDIAKRHGGEITVKSEAGIGTCVTLTLSRGEPRSTDLGAGGGTGGGENV